MIKKIILGMSILLFLSFAYNILIQITDSLKSGERLSKAADIVYKLELRNKELRKKFSEIQSPEFIEQQARDKLGLGKKGEVVVIIPEETLKLVMEGTQSAKEARFPNWQGWLKLFWH